MESKVALHMTAYYNQDFTAGNKFQLKITDYNQLGWLIVINFLALYSLMLYGHGKNQHFQGQWYF